MVNECATIFQKDRFDLKGCQRTMKAVVTNGNGGYEQLEYRDVPVPALAPGGGSAASPGSRSQQYRNQYPPRLVFFRGHNRHTISVGRRDRKGQSQGRRWLERNDAVSLYPGHRLLRAACRGYPGCRRSALGLRVLVRPCIRKAGWESLENIWLASDFDGAFAQLVKVKAGEVFPVDCDLSDAELGTIPSAYGTAENMVHRAKVSGGEHVLVAGASGGVGSAVRAGKDLSTRTDCGRAARVHGEKACGQVRFDSASVGSLAAGIFRDCVLKCRMCGNVACAMQRKRGRWATMIYRTNKPEDFF